MIPPKNILIVRTDRIGDVVLSLPLASIIKNHYPSSKISFLLRNYTSALSQNTSAVNETIILAEKNGKPLIFENIKLLKNKFDACVVAFPTLRIALILFLAGIKLRIGTGYRWYSFLFNKKIYDHRKYGDKHELEFNVRLLKHLGIEETIDENKIAFGLRPGGRNIENINRLFGQLRIDSNKQIVVIHPGSGGSAIDLPLDKLKELASLIAGELDCEILITGSGNEKELCDSMIVNSKTKSLAGKLELGDLIALIDKSVLLIANSTGPIHIAAALGKYVIGFYPKIAACSPVRWGPFTARKKIFTPNLECENCTREQCEKLNCMSSINIGGVFDSVKYFLNVASGEKK